MDGNDAARDLKREWVMVVSWHAQRTTPSSKYASMFSFPTLRKPAITVTVPHSQSSSILFLCLNARSEMETASFGHSRLSSMAPRASTSRCAP